MNNVATYRVVCECVVSQRAVAAQSLQLVTASRGESSSPLLIPFSFACSLPSPHSSFPLSSVATMSANFTWLQQPSLLHVCNVHVITQEGPAASHVSRRCACLGTTGGVGQGERVPVKMKRPYNPWRRAPSAPARLLARMVSLGRVGPPRYAVEPFGDHACFARAQSPTLYPPRP